MPRGPRLDYPGALHHAIFRGLERRELFVDDEDRQRLVDRLGHLVQDTRAAVYAWALMPNHVHLLVRPGPSGLSKLMQRFVGWYAAAFNRRHHRHGHLMQNRFKSILVEEDAYLLELVRYLHLNPVRAGLVRTIEELAHYPWTGHARLMGTTAARWQDVDFVLAQFTRPPDRARRAYHDFVLAGWQHGQRPDLQGGGLRRRRGCWEPVDELRRGREAEATDERILGGSPFVQQVLAQVNGERPIPRRWTALERQRAVRSLVERGARVWDQCPATVASSCKRQASATARAVVCVLAVERLGLSLTQVADELGVSKVSVWRGVQKGRALLARAPHIERDVLPALERHTPHGP